MDNLKFATIDFDGEVHHALRLRAAACNRSISAMMDEAVRITLAEDADDLRDADLRQAEPSTNFEDFLACLRDRDRLWSYH